MDVALLHHHSLLIGGRSRIEPRAPVGALGYVIKPVKRDDFLVQIDSALERRRLTIENRELTAGLQEKVRLQTAEIRLAHEETIYRLVKAAGYRDEETGDHVRRTGQYSELLAAAIGWPAEQVEMIRLAAPMHDIGKIGIPDAILCKRGELSSAEISLMQTHTLIGGRMFPRCRLGEGSVIREGATVHCGTAAGTATIIGKCCLLMTNSHVGHNCELSDDGILVSGALLGGHVQVEPRAIVSRNAVVRQHVRIGELALVGMLARITQDVPPFRITDQEGSVVAGNRIGMKRARLTLDEHAELRAAFSAIYRERIGRNAAVQYLQNAMTTAAGRRLLAFYAYESARGPGIRLSDLSSAA